MESNLTTNIHNTILESCELTTVTCPTDGNTYQVPTIQSVEIEGVLYDMEHDSIIYCETSDDWEIFQEDYHVWIDDLCYGNDDDNVVYDEALEEYNHMDNCSYGWISRNAEGYFCSESDYVYSETHDVCFIDSDVAERHGYYYRSCCEDYVRDDYSCGHDEERRENWCEFNNILKSVAVSQLETALKGGYDMYIKKIEKEPLGNKNLYVQKGMYDTMFSKTGGMKYTFGVEIETSSGDMGEFEDDFNWSCVYDGSISGGEYVTGILMGDNGMSILESMCDELSNYTEVNRSCGLHVHIGGFIPNRKFSMMAIRLGCRLQGELFMMQPLSRWNNNSFCKWIEEEKYEKINFNTGLQLLADYIKIPKFDKNNNKKLSHREGRYCPSRYTWLNLNNCNTKSINTTEFRMHSSTTNFMKMKYWILICMAFVRFCENNQRDIMFNIKHCSLKYVLYEAYNKELANDIWSYYKTRVEKFYKQIGEREQLHKAYVIKFDKHLITVKKDKSNPFDTERIIKGWSNL